MSPQPESSPPESTPGPSAADTPSSNPTTLWKVLTVVFAAAVVGLAIWLIVLYQDRQDLNDRIDSLEANQALLSAEAKSALTDAVAALGVAANELKASQNDVATTTAALNQANQARAQAQGGLQTAQSERDRALALAASARVCIRGSLAAVELLADDNASGAAAQLKTVAPACDVALK